MIKMSGWNSKCKLTSKIYIFLLFKKCTESLSIFFHNDLLWLILNSLKKCSSHTLNKKSIHNIKKICMNFGKHHHHNTDFTSLHRWVEEVELLMSQLRWENLRFGAIEMMDLTWSCLGSGSRWESCQRVERKTTAQSLATRLSSMRGGVIEVCQIELVDLGIASGNILPVHIETFLAFALWLGRRSMLAHLQ